MRYSQKQLVHEGFGDWVRGTASAMKTAATTLAPELTNAYGKVASHITAPIKAYRSQQPVQFLKELLAKETSIQLVKVISSNDKRQARPGNSTSQFSRVTRPKSVTLIKFLANVYVKGIKDTPVRDYKPYGEAVTTMSTGDPRTAPTQTWGSGEGKPIESQPISNTQKQEAPPKKEGNKKQVMLIAEVFRTSKGLELGDIYDEKTNESYAQYLTNVNVASPEAKIKKTKKPEFIKKWNSYKTNSNLSGEARLKDFIYNNFHISDTDLQTQSELLKAVKADSINDVFNALKRLSLVEDGVSQVETLKNLKLILN